MKSFLFPIFLVAAVAAHAVVQSDVILGRIQVNSQTRSTILSLPFTQLGGEPGRVSLDKIVLTDNLEDGTRIFCTINGGTYAWILTKGEWVSVATVTGNFTDDSSGITALQRGLAFWVEREGNDAAIKKPFYIFGEVGAHLAGTQTIASAIVGADGMVNAYTRVGNPNPNDVNLNELNWSGCAEGDRISMGVAGATVGFIEYIYDPSLGEWGYNEQYMDGKKRKKRWNNNVMLPAGQGFWYVRKNEGTATVSFPQTGKSN